MEVEAEDSEVAGRSEVEEAAGLESLAMEVDNGSESKVAAVEEGKRSRGQKWVPSLPPKQMRKRACATTAMQSTVGSQTKMESMGTVGTGCERCT